MKTWGSAAAVIAALRDDAAAEIERLERESAIALERMRSASAATVIPADGERLAAAQRTIADLEMDEDWQDVVAAAADRDAWISAVAARARRAIADAPDAVAWTAAMAADAIRQLPAPDCILTVPAALRPYLDDGWRAALSTATGKTIVIEDGPFAAGCLARTADGRVSFDNRTEAREARTLAQWQASVADLYERAVSEATVETP